MIKFILRLIGFSQNFYGTFAITFNTNTEDAAEAFLTDTNKD